MAVQMRMRRRVTTSEDYERYVELSAHAMAQVVPWSVVMHESQKRFENSLLMWQGRIKRSTMLWERGQ